MPTQLDEEDLFADENDDFGLGNTTKSKEKQPGKRAEVVVKDEEDEDLMQHIASFSQRVKQGGGGNRVDDFGTTLTPRNPFEEFLTTQCGCELRKSDGEEYVWLAGDMTHSGLLLKLNELLSDEQKCGRLLPKIQKAFNERKTLTILLAPIRTQFGPQDTIIRALLLTPGTQTAVFGYLLEAVEKHSEGAQDDAEQLGLLCVAQIRYLDYVVDSGALAMGVINRDFSKWIPTVRDELVRALPEVIPDSLNQQEVALRLRNLVLERDPNLQKRGFRQAALSSLSLLWTSPSIAEEIALSLINNINSYDAASIAQVIEIALNSAETLGPGGLLKILGAVRDSLRVESMKIDKEDSSGKALDELVCEIFMKFPATCDWLARKNGPATSEDANSDDGPQDEGEDVEIEEQSENLGEQKAFTLFELLLAISLLSQENCPPEIEQALKNPAGDLATLDQFKETVSRAFKFKKFVIRNREGILRLANRLLWSNDEPIREIGGLIYAGTIQAVGVNNSKDVLSKLLDHLTRNDGEAAACLAALESLVENALPALKPNLDTLKESLDSLSQLSGANCLRLFRLLVSIYTNDVDCEKLRTEVCESIERFSRAPNPRSKLWAILGLITQFEAAFNSKASTREASISSVLTSIDQISTGNPLLRAVSYRFLADIFRRNGRAAKSGSLQSWARKLCDSFKTDFFKERPVDYVAAMRLEDDTYRIPSTRWLSVESERWPEFVPLLDLVEQLSLLDARWSHGNAKEAEKAHWSEINFVFEANLAADRIDEQAMGSEESALISMRECFFMVHALYSILNTFAPSAEATAENLANIQKKYALLDDCLKRLMTYVLDANEWKVPDMDLDRNDRYLATKKPSKRRAPATGQRNGRNKKKKSTDAEDVEDPFHLAFDDEDEQQQRPGSSDAAPPAVEEPELDIEDQKELFPVLRLSVICKLIAADSLSLTHQSQLLTLFADIVRTHLPKREKRFTAFLAKDNRSFALHGSMAEQWSLSLRTVPRICQTIAQMRVYFKADQGDSNVTDQNHREHAKRIGVLLAALQGLSAILDYKEAAQGEKREKLLNKIEKGAADYLQIAATPSQDTGVVACQMVAQLCEVCPSIDIATILSEMAVGLLPECTEALRRDFALYLLGFLRKEWTDEGKPLKGPQIATAAATIFQKYIQIRERADRLVALEWLTLVKVARVTSRKSGAEKDATTVADPLITPESDGIFHSISKGTFTAIYRAALTCLNEVVDDDWAKPHAVSNRALKADEVMDRWVQASSIFAALSAMLQHKALRTSGMLYAFSREGRKFLHMFTKNSSFFPVFDKHLAQLSQKGHKTLRAMQMGTRYLSQISLHAKQHRSAVLLRSLPEIRVCTESFLRQVQTWITRWGVADSVEYGILVARNIDGEKILPIDDDAADEAAAPPPETPPPKKQRKSKDTSGKTATQAQAPEVRVKTEPVDVDDNSSAIL
ncbi:unnamed protein product, partial [Mesorhabditis spiculigera]